MDVQVRRTNNLSYGLIYGLYSDKELEEIYAEAEMLYPFRKPPSETFTAVDDVTQEPLKAGGGIILDRFYEHRDDSKILTYNRRLFSKDVTDELEAGDAYFANLANSNHDHTLVNFYSNGDHYKRHRDQGLITAVTMLKRGEFTGGDFCFPSHGVTVPFEENLCVLFPCCVEHEATPIVTNDGLRVTIAQFIGYSTKE